MNSGKTKIYGLLNKLVCQDGCILAKFFFICLRCKNEQGQYPGILTKQLVNKGFIIWKKKEI